MTTETQQAVLIEGMQTKPDNQYHRCRNCGGRALENDKRVWSPHATDGEGDPMILCKVHEMFLDPRKRSGKVYTAQMFEREIKCDGENMEVM